MCPNDPLKVSTWVWGCSLVGKVSAEHAEAPQAPPNVKTKMFTNGEAVYRNQIVTDYHIICPKTARLDFF